MTILPPAPFPFSPANRQTRPTELRRPAAARRPGPRSREPLLPPPVPPRRCEPPLHAPPRRREACPSSRLGRQAAPPLLPSSIHHPWTPGGAPPAAAVVLGEHRCHCAVSPFHRWGESCRPLERAVRAPPSSSATARRRQGPGQASPSPRHACVVRAARGLAHAPLVLAARSVGLAPRLPSSSRRPPPPWCVRWPMPPSAAAGPPCGTARSRPGSTCSAPRRCAGRRCSTPLAAHLRRRRLRAALPRGPRRHQRRGVCRRLRHRQAVLRERQAAIGALAQELEEKQYPLGVGEELDEDVHGADLHGLGGPASGALHDVQQHVERAGTKAPGDLVGQQHVDRVRTKAPERAARERGRARRGSESGGVRKAGEVDR
ncbi:vegetative cell wall protein gp1-like [Panicum virgatum]|uniref:vegetative cell wall protein gp1-like n=1 Tax=Panicum virgatum TaxID=38727 RepID=UPI0019D6A719|nr:vegetative cell wall protein gp1-like [Panicum virgatum]